MGTETVENLPVAASVTLMTTQAGPWTRVIPGNCVGRSSHALTVYELGRSRSPCRSASLVSHSVAEATMSNASVGVSMVMVRFPAPAATVIGVFQAPYFVPPVPV